MALHGPAWGNKSESLASLVVKEGFHRAHTANLCFCQVSIFPHKVPFFPRSRTSITVIHLFSHSSFDSLNTKDEYQATGRLLAGAPHSMSDGNLPGYCHKSTHSLPLSPMMEVPLMSYVSRIQSSNHGQGKYPYPGRLLPQSSPSISQAT